MNARIAVIFSVLVISGIIALNDATAADGWYECTVEFSGVYQGSVVLSLSHISTAPAFTNQFFIAYPGTDNRVLAVALTAQNNGSPLGIVSDLAAPQGSYYVMKAAYVMP